jgi:hypothetical protein
MQAARAFIRATSRFGRSLDFAGFGGAWEAAVKTLGAEIIRWRPGQCITVTTVRAHGSHEPIRVAEWGNGEAMLHPLA